LSLRRYRDYEHTYDRLIELEPDKPALTLQRARSTLWGNAVDGLPLLYNLAAIYGMVNESDLAFQVLAVSAKIPGGVSYGELKLDPCWDPLRKDPRFEKLLAELAPRD
jgi:hypothetical protein